MNWPVVISSVSVLIAAVALLRTEHWRRKTVTTDKEKELADKVDKAEAKAQGVKAEQAKLRERIKHMPSQRQIDGLGQRMGDIAAEVKGLHAGLEAQSKALGTVSRSVNRIEDYLLNKSGRQQ